MRRSDSFTPIVHAAVTATPIRRLLESHAAVVLERIARGGGGTNWFYCRSPPELAVIEGDLRPGSVVSFYFDERIRTGRYSPALAAEIEAIIAATGDSVLGVLCDDGIHVEGTVAVSREDLAEEAAELAPSATVLYGAFPGRDNDGIRAVTVRLPDMDGIVRPHPC